MRKENLKACAKPWRCLGFYITQSQVTEKRGKEAQPSLFSPFTMQ